MQATLTGTQWYSLFHIIQGLSFFERLALLGLNWRTHMTVANLWCLCYTPALRFGLQHEHDLHLTLMGNEFGFTIEEMLVFEHKALLKLQYPSRVRQLESTLQGSCF